ncbi:MAG: type toxin-antitoxin system RelE/ParE family toxin [Devosia sp.]|uniref:type II toxin-antitoxin system RelE family toxin n=1 Tax=Devosia sp. TaxID=1871048 RepID=UPI00261CF0E3|nr:type II toxin-antitoxin system RelE/ParE family toxin [Devosia sp.]MDB5528938.1 type toxin-antitoxin system RelE/ParE family toxin [Devosia sp.]
MTYNLDFTRSARREWDRIDAALREQFKNKLDERLRNPRVVADAMRRMPSCYKIKLRKSGFRLVYLVQDERITVLVLSVGKRDADKTYLKAARELDDLD